MLIYAGVYLLVKQAMEPIVRGFVVDLLLEEVLDHPSKDRKAKDSV
jgi:hypothetical protein